MEDVKVTAMLPEQRCTIASVAGHAMYERSNPYYEYFLGGHIDMSDCVYEQFDERTTRVTGPRFVPAEELRVKLEGAGKVGERYVGIVGVRDPYTIARIDEVIAWAKAQVRERFGDDWLPRSPTPSMAATASWASSSRCVTSRAMSCASSCRASRRPGRWPRKCASSASRQMFYARLPDVKGTAGGVAFLLDEVMPASAAYRWTLNHTMRVDDPMELFPCHMIEAGGLSDGHVRWSIWPRPSAARMPASTRSPSTSSSRTARRMTGSAAAACCRRAAVCKLLRHPRQPHQRPRRIRSRHWRSSSRCYRQQPSGSVGDADIFGSQQYGPLLGVEVPAV